MLLATKVLVCFLRGLLTNLDTPPVTSDIRSILVRPLIVRRLDRLSTCSDDLYYSSVPRRRSSRLSTIRQTQIATQR